MESYDVLTIGRSCLDLIILVDNFPKENSKMPLSLRIMEAGGQGGTSACCISKLGGKVAYIGQVGNDPEGQFCLKRLRDFNVDTNYTKIIPEGKTPIAYIIVTKSNGNRTILYEKNTLPMLNVKDIPIDIFFNSSVILIDPETTYLAKESIPKIRSKIVYDCERWQEGVEYMMENADFFVPSADFLKSGQLFGDNEPFIQKALKLKSLVTNELVITCGEDGAYFGSNNKFYHVSAPKVDVKDTIGAGDNFHAAFSLAISKNLDIFEAVKFSVAVASLSCREFGGKNGIPNLTAAKNLATKLSVRSIG